MTEELPRGWAEVPLGHIASTQLGKMLSKKSKMGLRPRLYLRNQNVQWHRFDLSDLSQMDFTEDESIKFELQFGDLLVCEGGEIGRCATWNGQVAEMHFQKALHRVRPMPDVHVKYLEYWLRWSADTGRLSAFTSGSTIGHLPQQEIRRLRVPLAPKEEQCRIVAAIEEHFSHLDTGSSLLKSAALRLARLLESTLQERLEGVWDELPLEAFAKRNGITDGPFGSKLKTSHYTTSGPRVIRLENIARGRFVDVETHISRSHYTELRRHEILPEDLVVASLVSDRLRACPVPPDLGPAVVKADCIRIRPRSNVDSRYLNYALMRPSLDSFVSKRIRGVGRARLGLANVRAIPIPAAPYDEQQRIADELDLMTTQVDALSTALLRSLRRAQSLRRSILSAAFSGRLVPQDPNDEPAAVLLDRIGTAR